MAGDTSSSQEELEEASEGQVPEVHSAFNTALSDRASCNHHAKRVGPSSAPRGGGKVGCLSPAARNTDCMLSGQMFTAAGSCLWPDSENIVLVAGLVVHRFDISCCLIKPWRIKQVISSFRERNEC